jgi:hypothetical protein
LNRVARRAVPGGGRYGPPEPAAHGPARGGGTWHTDPRSPRVRPATTITLAVLLVVIVGAMVVQLLLVR